jgi:osmotically-inducible protein OsmY
MKGLFVLVVGIGLGVLGYWYYTEGRNKESVQRAEQNATQEARRITEAVKEKLGDIRAEDIKEELAKTGKVVRQKAEKAGAAVADAATNARITAAIKAKYALDPDLSALKTSVDTTDGVVTLAGTVSSAEAVAKAMTLALETEGVREVVSNLQIKN